MAKLTTLSATWLVLLACHAFAPAVEALYSTANTCPKTCPLARTQGFWKNWCYPSTPGGTPIQCDTCAQNCIYKYDAQKIASKCKQSTISACVRLSSNSCWTQLSALLLDIAGCDTVTKPLMSALYNPTTIIKALPKCQYLKSCSSKTSVTLTDIYTSSLTEAQRSSDGCTAVRECLGKFLGSLDVKTGCATQYLTCNTSPECTTGGSGCADPIFVGFNNFRYAFNGLAGNVYNIFSEEDTHVNAQMVHGTELRDNQTGPGTFMGVATVQHHTDRVLVRSEFGSRVEVSVNGVQLELSAMQSSSQLVLPDSTRVKLWSRKQHVADAVQVSTPKLTVIFTGQGHHLNLHIVRVAGGMCDVHGVLGQTYNGEAYDPATPAPAAFQVQGVDADYQTTGLFAVDSKFNRFGKEPTHCYEHLKNGRKDNLAGPGTTQARRLLDVNRGCIGVFGDRQQVAECLTSA